VALLNYQLNGSGGKNARSENFCGEATPVLSIAVVDPDLERRNLVAGALCALRSSTLVPRVTTLANVADSGFLTSQSFSVVLVAVDGDQEAALRTIEAICRAGRSVPMAYAQRTGDDLLVRCMRSGVRELLLYPFAPGVLEDAFSRTESRGHLMPDPGKAAGKSFAFLGAKGGAGVTTAACNFAISLAQESKRNTLLIDLDLPLGDATLSLGIACEHSTIDALRECDRLDSAYLQSLVTRHSSGLSVLGAPGKFQNTPFTDEAIERLVEVAGETFDYVVIDAGSRWDLAETRVFDMISTIYLVTQVGVAELRNSNRLITGCLQKYESKLEIVVNRYKSEMFGIEDQAIDEALTRTAQWRIPNDYDAVCEMQNTATPLALKKSSIQRVIQSMARIASGMPQEQKQKKKFTLFGATSGA
jgi:pilus assembly protein CpaE